MPAKTGLIGCIMLRRGGSLTKSPFYAEVFENIEAEVTRSGYNVVYSSMTDDELWHGPGQPVAQPRLIDLPIRGVVLVGGLTDELATAYLHRGVRVLLLDKLLLHALISSIIPDNTGGMAAATRYLVELGHRRFVFVGAPDDPVVSARREGIVKSLQDASIPADRLLTLAAGYAAEPACEAVGRLLDSLAGGNRPTAFLCINDESAIGTLRALKARGFHVPGDVSVTGFDDIAASAQTEPPLTTVRVDKKEMGRLAARLLIDQIEAEQASSVKLILQTELVVRSSSARPKTEEQASPPHADAVRPDVPESRLVR
ncbi:MAG: HTH-type transcriptional repressor CytR [Verrucomicrobia bacterium ADurb.Bin345]|nr:MAG: HTH-type transcriptional repressor CytR [Verrucomicrobia bacterium ADurb.Bin345]